MLPGDRCDDNLSDLGFNGLNYRRKRSILRLLFLRDDM